MTSPTTTRAHRILVVNCYPRPSRENFDRSDVGHPHDLFRAFLAKEAPNATAEIGYIADPGSGLPAGTTIDDFDGFIWTGSDLSVNHSDDPRVAPQIAFAGQLLEAGKACWGSCWGIQLATVVAGGEVSVNPRGREWGVARNITLTEAAATAPMHRGKPASFDAFIMHLDEVTRLPDGTPLLATNEHTPVQAAIIGTFWATQYHPEYDLHQMGRLVAARAGALVREGIFPDEPAVAHHADLMKQLAAEPGSAQLRRRLGIGDDIIDPRIRQVELRNWLRFVDSLAPVEGGSVPDGRPKDVDA
jgi:GMP synthase (glutamine-hydrolysing)